jgi:hypothetical protein
MESSAAQPIISIPDHWMIDEATLSTASAAVTGVGSLQAMETQPPQAANELPHDPHPDWPPFDVVLPLLAVILCGYGFMRHRDDFHVSRALDKPSSRRVVPPP